MVTDKVSPPPPAAEAPLPAGLVQYSHTLSKWELVFLSSCQSGLNPLAAAPPAASQSEQEKSTNVNFFVSSLLPLLPPRLPGDRGAAADALCSPAPPRWGVFAFRGSMQDR